MRRDRRAAPTLLVGAAAVVGLVLGYGVRGLSGPSGGSAVQPAVVHVARAAPEQWCATDTEEVYQQRLERRAKKLAETRLDPVFQTTPMIWFLYEPLWSCPAHEELVGDGVKWVCGVRELKKLKEICVAYSFGSNGDDQYETDLHAVSGCEVHTFDPTLTEEKEAKLTPFTRKNFQAIGLAPEDGHVDRVGPVRSLPSIMRQLGHKRVDILKIDIEGMEFEVFSRLAQDGFPDVGQILVEVHAFKAWQPIPPPVNGRPSELRTKLDKLFADLEGAGYRLFHKEINVLYTKHKYANMGVEYAFMKVDPAKGSPKFWCGAGALPWTS